MNIQSDRFRKQQQKAQWCKFGPITHKKHTRENSNVIPQQNELHNKKQPQLVALIRGRPLP